MHLKGNAGWTAFNRGQSSRASKCSCSGDWFVACRGIGRKIPFVSNDQVSFENLVKKFSTEKHPRSILNELERLNIVKEEDGLVMLQQRSFMPDVEQFEVRKLLTNNLEAHLAAGVHNLFQPEKNPI